MFLSRCPVRYSCQLLSLLLYIIFSMGLIDWDVDGPVSPESSSDLAEALLY